MKVLLFLALAAQAHATTIIFYRTPSAVFAVSDSRVTTGGDKVIPAGNGTKIWQAGNCLVGAAGFFSMRTFSGKKVFDVRDIVQMLIDGKSWYGAADALHAGMFFYKEDPHESTEISIACLDDTKFTVIRASNKGVSIEHASFGGDEGYLISGIQDAVCVQTLKDYIALYGIREGLSRAIRLESRTQPRYVNGPVQFIGIAKDPSPPKGPK